jgi:hypothetical protein
MYSHTFLVTSVRGSGLSPMMAASAALGVMAFMKAALGVRFLAGAAFFAGAAGGLLCRGGLLGRGGLLRRARLLRGRVLHRRGPSWPGPSSRPGPPSSQLPFRFSPSIEGNKAVFPLKKWFAPSAHAVLSLGGVIAPCLGGSRAPGECPRERSCERLRRPRAARYALPMIKLIVRWTLLAAALLLVAHLYPGVTVASFGAALVAALVLGLLNTWCGRCWCC